MSTELTTTNPFTPTTMEAAETMAGWIADSGCFGIKKPAQALTLMFLAHEEQSTLSQLLKKTHVFEDGKLSTRADHIKREFEKKGTIIFHIRTDEMVAASFYDSKPIDDEARQRGIKRFELQWRLDAEQAQPERNSAEESKLMLEISKLAREGEITVIRTLADAEAKGISKGKSGTKSNWLISPRTMLQWRCITEGANVVGAGEADGMPSDVDLADAREVEHAQLMKEAFGPKPDERTEALKKIIEDKKQASLEAGSDSDAKRLQAEAAELQATLDNEEGERLARERQATQQPTTTPLVVDDNPELLPPENKAPASEKADDWKAATFSHLNLTTRHSCFGKTVGEVFDTGDLANAQRIMGTFLKADGYMSKVAAQKALYDAGKVGPPHEKDLALYNALIQANARVSERLDKEGAQP